MPQWFEIEPLSVTNPLGPATGVAAHPYSDPAIGQLGTAPAAAPNRFSKSMPQQNISTAVVRPQVANCEAVNDLKTATVFTATGERLHGLLPLQDASVNGPSSDTVLFPQQYALPAEVSAHTFGPRVTI